MSEGNAALAHVRRLFAEVDTGAVALAAELLTAIQSARDILADAADEDSPAGIAAGIVFQLLSDAIASAEPPKALPHV